MFGRIRYEAGLEDDLTEDPTYQKVYGEFSLKHQFKNKGKYFRMRLFAGRFLSRSKTYSGRQNFMASGNNGQNDYLYEHVLMGRSENFLGDNFFSRQIIERDGAMRNVYPAPGADIWLTAINTEMTLPGILPLKLYFDGALTNPYLVQTNKGAIREPSEFYYTGGVAITFDRAIFEVYIPLVYSSYFKDFNKSFDRNGFQQISFKLNLNFLNVFDIQDYHLAY
jgi:hypothetical protein